MSYYQKIIRLMELRVAVHLDTILKLMDGRVAVLYEYLDKNIKLEKDQIPLILNKLKEKLDIYEKEFKIDEDDILEKNLNFLQNTLNLTSTQVNIIRMGAVVLNYNSYILDQMTSSYKSELEIYTFFSRILNESIEKIKEAFELKNSFRYMVKLYGGSSYRANIIDTKDDFLKYLLVENGIYKFIKYYTYELSSSNLKFSDFDHIKQDLAVLIPYLKYSIENELKGVNILFYGKPGVGKSEICSLIANKCNVLGLGIKSYFDDYNIVYSMARISSIDFISNFVSKDTIFIYDEAEDIFNLNSNDKQDNKAFVNYALENNKRVVIYITNDVGCIDEAILRRFDFIMEFKDIPKNQKLKIIDKYSKNLVDDKTKELFSSSPDLQPATIAKVSKVIETLNLKDASNEFKLLTNNTLNAFGYGGMEFKKEIKYTPKEYDISLLNSDYDLENLANKVKNDVRICLYGPSGSGKSAYAFYLADRLKKELIIKTGSDLLSPYIGENEKNIKNAFLLAKQKDAILLIDEIEGFLFSRNRATKSWELTMANEFLTSMQSFDGIFISTSNLFELIDSAVLRRFDFMVELRPLNFIQAKDIFQNRCENLGFKPSEELLNSFLELSNITIGDFESVKRSMKFLDVNSADEYFDLLKQRCLLKIKANFQNV